MKIPCIDKIIAGSKDIVDVKIGNNEIDYKTRDVLAMKDVIIIMNIKGVLK